MDYLNYDPMGIEHPDLLIGLFEAIRFRIEDAIDETLCKPRALQKVAWLVNYFNDSLARWLSDSALAEFHPALQHMTPIEPPTC